MLELTALFAAAFTAATLLPLPSEAALLAYLHLHPERVGVAVATATAGNTAGGMTTYLIGRLFPRRKEFSPRALFWIRRYGAAATLLAWLPVIGDALCAVAGWLRLNWLAVLAFMAAGRLARYAAVAYYAA